MKIIKSYDDADDDDDDNDDDAVQEAQGCQKDREAIQDTCWLRSQIENHAQVESRDQAARRELGMSVIFIGCPKAISINWTIAVSEGVNGWETSTGNKIIILMRERICITEAKKK